MADRKPLLQIVHVTDLHVKRGPSDFSRLSSGEIRGRVWLRKLLERHNIGGWHDGTLGHDDTGASHFRRRLEAMVTNEPQWLGGSGHGAETWLVDSGDATVDGDGRSIAEAQALLDQWQAALGNCRVLSLFGNHDAWPGTHPAVISRANYPAEIARQKAELARWPRWNNRDWLQKPLSTSPDPGVPRIEFYGLNSVSDAYLANILATGEIDSGELAELKQQIDNRRDSQPVFRILLTHHPLSFPYKFTERQAVGTLPQMVLKSAENIVGELRNSEGGAQTCSPFIHLFLSGHTHMAAPGRELPENIKNLRQGRLGRTQAQLVGGSLMQLHPRLTSEANYRSQVRQHPDFSDASVFSDPQQFQVLQFFYDPDMSGGLWLDRWVFARTSIKRSGYVPVRDLCSSMFVLHSDES